MRSREEKARGEGEGGSRGEGEGKGKGPGERKGWCITEYQTDTRVRATMLRSVAIW